ARAGARSLRPAASQLQDLLQIGTRISLVVAEPLEGEAGEAPEAVELAQVGLVLGVAQVDREGEGDVRRELAPYGEAGAGMGLAVDQHRAHRELAETERPAERREEARPVI